MTVAVELLIKYFIYLTAAWAAIVDVILEIIVTEVKGLKN